MIAAVISAASCMQAAGGLDYMVKLAEKLLRKNPSQVTILSPIVTYLFTFVAGTGHVAYSVLPVIAEVATETKIRPERPLGIAVIASQQAITASPISAATVALLGLLAGFDITLFFSNIVYTLTVSFGDIGKALAVVLLVMQVGGSGGTFPIEMTGPVFQAIYPFLPFTHGINAMHAAMAGAYHMEYWIELGILASYLIPSLALGVVFRRPVIKANDWIIEKLESTKLI